MARQPPQIDPHAHFVHEYDANGNNGTTTYLAAYPTCKSRAAAAAASRLLRIVKVRQAIDALAEARWRRLAMSGDEAAALVANDARADVRQIFDENSQLLPVHLWPDSVARSVKAIRPGPFGTTIVLNDSLAARRIILEQTGTLKSSLAGGGDLARILAGDFENEE